MQQQQHRHQQQLQQQPQQYMEASGIEWPPATAGVEQPQRPVEHQPLAPPQPDMRIPEVWQMPVEHQPLAPPQPDTRITKYATSVVIPLHGQKEALLPLHKVPEGMHVFAVQTKPGIATLKCGTNAMGWATEGPAIDSSNRTTLQLMVIAENEGETGVQVGWTTPKGHYYLTGVWVTVHPGPQQNRPKSNSPPRTRPRSTSRRRSRAGDKAGPRHNPAAPGADPPHIRTGPRADPKSSQTGGGTGPTASRNNPQLCVRQRQSQWESTLRLSRRYTRSGNF